MSFSKSSSPDSRRRKHPEFRQHFLKRLPEPHGHKSLRPTFSISSLSPCTTRSPRFTCVSEGKPLRRLLMISKAGQIVVDVLIHDTPPSPVK
jgi:hypothetical protein